MITTTAMSITMTTPKKKGRDTTNTANIQLTTKTKGTM